MIRDCVFSILQYYSVLHEEFFLNFLLPYFVTDSVLYFAGSVADVGGSESGFSSEEIILHTHDALTYDQHRRLNDGTGFYWCVSKDAANVYMLQTALNWTCSSFGGGVNCNPIYAGGNCYLPNTIQKHSSWAFNMYYNSQSGAPDSCNFSGTAMVTINDPSEYANSQSPTLFQALSIKCVPCNRPHIHIPCLCTVSSMMHS